MIIFANFDKTLSAWLDLWKFVCSPSDPNIGVIAVFCSSLTYQLAKQVQAGFDK